MKKSIEILGLPVISITEGSELGTTKSLVINAAQGAVAAIAVEDGKWYLGAKLLPFSAVTGIGESAITVENSSNIVAITNSPEMEKLLETDIKVIGAKVLTKSGRIQGRITEILVDDSGKIVSCELEGPNGEIGKIEGQKVMTYGKEVVIIADGDAAVTPAPAAPVAAAATVKPAEPAAPAVAPVAAPVEAATETNDDSAKKFDDKQRKYLLGKKVTRRIETDNGVLIVDQGAEITEEVIQKAKLAGKFVELSMSI